MRENPSVPSVPSVSISTDELIERCSDLGIDLWAEGDRLRFDAPQGVLTVELRAALAAHKPELLSRLASPSPEPAPAFLADRWGPALEHDLPSLDVTPPAWRLAVARLPHDDWVRWRQRSGELQAALGHPPTIEDIDLADESAYRELVEPPPSDPDLAAWIDRGWSPTLDPIPEPIPRPR